MQPENPMTKPMQKLKAVAVARAMARAEASSTFYDLNIIS